MRRIREKLGHDFIIIFRLSMLDLVENGSTWEEIVMVKNSCLEQYEKDRR